jgi:hypothetical protein
VKLVAVAVAVNDHVNDHVNLNGGPRERKTHLNQKGHAGAFGVSTTAPKSRATGFLAGRIHPRRREPLKYMEYDCGLVMQRLGPSRSEIQPHEIGSRGASPLEQ